MVREEHPVDPQVETEHTRSHGVFRVTCLPKSDAQLELQQVIFTIAQQVEQVIYESSTNWEVGGLIPGCSALYAK